LTLKGEENRDRKLTWRADLKTKRRNWGLTGRRFHSGLAFKPTFEEPRGTPTDPKCAIKSTIRARTGFNVKTLRVLISNRNLKKVEHLPRLKQIRVKQVE